VNGYLLDTHAILWHAVGDERLSRVAAEILEAKDSNRCVSVASAWEVAIKLNLGRLSGISSLDELFDYLYEVNVRVLDIHFPHLQQYTALPLENHRDPFDRMIVAQALADDLFLVSADAKLDAYGVRRIWLPTS
jgi:PIN domain nuclease of toxin-antitoxin system